MSRSQRSADFSGRLAIGYVLKVWKRTSATCGKWRCAQSVGEVSMNTKGLLADLATAVVRKWEPRIFRRFLEGPTLEIFSQARLALSGHCPPDFSSLEEIRAACRDTRPRATLDMLPDAFRISSLRVDLASKCSWKVLVPIRTWLASERY